MISMTHQHSKNGNCSKNYMFENHLLEEVFSNTLFEKLDFCSARKVFLNGKLHFFRTE